MEIAMPIMVSFGAGANSTPEVGLYTIQSI